jgi:nucleotidyltransferase substrate binding protein (TIGR01987 family)
MKMSLDLSSLDNALGRLSEGLALAAAAPADELRRDGVIQRFEYSYELCVKMLRRYIEMTAATPGNVDALAFADLIRTGAEQGLLRAAWPAWRDFRTARGTTSHTYDPANARQVFAVIPHFLEEAAFLRDQLRERTVRP